MTNNKTAKSAAEIDLELIEEGKEPVGGWDEWAKHQRPVSEEKAAEIDKALFPEGRPWSPILYLKGLHTRQLMALRRRIYAVNSHGDRHLRDEDEMFYNIVEGNPKMVITMGQLKRELATREHIPNKAEAKEIRRAKAKAQRNR